jgi:hypothetical protein
MLTGCYLVIPEATHYLSVSVTTETEMILSEFCTLTVKVCSFRSNGFMPAEFCGHSMYS